MKSPEFIAEFNRAFCSSLSSVPELDPKRFPGNRASEAALEFISEHQKDYDVPRTIHLGIVDGETFVHDRNWIARAMWPDHTSEDWVVINSRFVERAHEQAKMVARTMLRHDRAQTMPAVEAKAAVAREERCFQTILCFVVSHELAHHAFGHQLLYKPKKSIGDEIERSIEFAADIHGFRCAAIHSLALADGDGGFADPEGQLLAIQNSAAYMAAVLPLLAILKSPHSLRDMPEGHHPYQGYRALLAHQIWVNEAKMRAPYMTFDDLDEFFIQMLKHVCTLYLAQNDYTHFEALLREVSARKRATNRLTQPVGYMSALYGVEPDWIINMRKVHDKAIPTPNVYARGALFQDHPYDVIM
jgi:hypothetical protein